MYRVLIGFLVLISIGVALITVASNSPESPIERQSEQTALYREIFDRLATRHYRGQTIDDALSKRYLSEYLDQLDPLKGYFLQSDIDEFNQWQTKLDDLAKRGDVKPGFFIFNRLRERATAPVSYTHLTLPTICSV